ncbi:Abscisic acid G-protein coupled receptor-domain-containing protein [Cantharellus anzutake]|uniref:Abscisic acid G-protein coupled receptor-domain-containing protein n=1 Tax=Cantharellus anzutake TaxID=1750568 RepID=UPI0019088E0C|nr:Abscisic acid G-protein coupled receptor-domain-containing protein [Cantharellus anzutake]KAF8342709.1 Abscisic acid G-protein coupled receptor-domain-containing protein [Cantharellus anzutake]
MSAHSMVQTSFLTLVRVGLYLSCHRYLLRSLVQDLRHLSIPLHAPFSSASRAGFEIDPPESPLRPGVLPLHVASSVVPKFPGEAKSPWHSKWSYAAFSLCFSESCILFLLVVFQSMDIFSESARLLNWELSLSLLVALILLVIPLLQCLLVLYPSSKHSITSLKTLRPRHLVIPVSLYLVYLYSITYIPLPESHKTAAGASSSSLSVLYSIVLGRLVVLGVFSLGVLSGFGAARNVSTLCAFLCRGGDRSRNSRTGGLEDIASAERGLARVESELSDKRRALMREEASVTKQPQGTWLSRLFGSNAPFGLHEEISALEALRDQMSLRVQGTKALRAQEAFESSITGKIWKAVNLALGLYCVYRILSAMTLIFMPSLRSPSSQSGLSPTDLAVQWLFTLFPSLKSRISPEQAVSLTRQLSLLMVGVIVLGSIRVILTGVNKMLRMTSKKIAASFMLLTLAQILGTYLLSTLIQLSTSFPPSSDAAAKSLFATLPDFEVFGPLFDASFLVSVCVSALVRTWTAGVKGLINDYDMVHHGEDGDVGNRGDWELISVGRKGPS